MPRSFRPSARPSDRGRLAGVFASVVAVIALAALISALSGRDFFASLRDLTGAAPESGTAAPSQQPGDSADPADAARAREQLAGIEIAEPRPRGDYERDEFGSGWVDTDDNGCSTRNDVLARDLDDAVVESDCRVVAGVLDDPYTGDRIEFSSDDPQAVQIDHVVPLSLAWRMGADEWDRDRRVEFANDFGNLLAADGPANGQKSDSGPADWQPYAGFQCSYAMAYIDVTDRYGLALATEDRDALSGMLDTCG
ncbi:HNH endonuclease family protein [Marinactinospora rubrisoli]|uniref:HNH endonuclease family protein n=1 Tax=Marinactinospora rubrisoli TaxID=2715399 RepID=A0ABW2KBG6_9ACTN